jgi:N-succinyldiaminopimelate aminotransferase
MMGIPEVRTAIAAHYGRWHGLNLDPMTEVMVTSGGTEALTAAILAVVEPGDEVIVFQPVYDSYLPIIRQAGGIPRLLRLEPPHWRLNEEMLRSAFNHKTKAVLFNNPLNPAAVVYPREDLELLARFCQEFDSIAICDEVWEHVVFDGREHIPADHDPGHARPHHQGRQRGQDLFADRMEDRVCLCGAAAAAGSGKGAPVSHLHHGAQFAGRGGLWPQQAGRILL